jgi:hypothetical protein
LYHELFRKLFLFLILASLLKAGKLYQTQTALKGL